MADDREIETKSESTTTKAPPSRRNAQIRKLSKNDLAVAIGGLMLGCCTQGCCGGIEPVLF